jgi:hypothetical protein
MIKIMKTSTKIAIVVGLLFGIIPGIVVWLVARNPNEEKERILKKRRMCRICRKSITKIQAETEGICQECFDVKYETEGMSIEEV